ncbi:ubiquitin carboxyl-terminal hydrolase calypso isoform X2 [Aethina tumida]|uniref:ubiquitin carboxyl-terminal hydrolase calypso isoform X2 n=1 Tax=Aethina tumida TaxID=116153 RepID=UPI00096B66E9|nr:ubiquitin carboxyl-terminal hydrolase calypso isoform X2 [Aethina tumida]
MPVDIKELTEGWLELESDPGLFTLLLEDFGVKGVQVEEIYDLNKPLDSTVYGFIFLFRWVEERRSRRKVVEQTETFVKDEDVVNNIFFAQQMVPNSCATHALISILLNCPNIHLGETLTRLKVHTHGMSPENKGWAIGNTPELACAHNSHAMPQAKRRLEKGSSGVSTGRFTGEAFHFVSFVPIGGRLYELDGLKPFPIDHGPCSDVEWTEKFRNVMTDRLGINDEYSEIRFNLMAVVPDRRLAIHHKLKMLRTNKQIVLDALSHLVKIKDKTTNQEKKESLVTENDKPSTEKETAEVKPEGPSEEGHNMVKKDAENPSNSKVTLCPLDYATPLTIQTSPAPSTSGTDTSSDIGSAFNSPTQAWNWANTASQNSPSSKDLKRFVVLRMEGENSTESKPLESGERKSGGVHARVRTSDGDPVVAEKKPHELLEPHTFAPKDLLALLRNLESEICMCEMSLKDENDKQNKYKIDDGRRTHNYDEFICTFLSMLAQQGKLGDLVEQNLVIPKKPGVNTPPAPKTIKTTKKDTKKKKKGRTKVKRKR